MFKVLKKNKYLFLYLGFGLWVYGSFRLFQYLFGQTDIGLIAQSINFFLTGLVAWFFVHRRFNDLSQDSKQKEKQIDTLEKRKTEILQKVENVQGRLIETLRKAPSPAAILLGENHRYDFVNDAYLKMLGHKKLLGKTVREVFPEVEEQGLIEKLDQVYNTGTPYSDLAQPLEIKKGDKTKVYYRDVIYNPLLDNDGNINGVFIQSNDITKQVEIKKELEKSLEENQLLLQELHHRVKNNLTVIIGILDMQSEKFDNDEIQTLLTSTQARIYTIAHIQDALYNEKSLDKISLNSFILELPDRIFGFYNKKCPPTKAFAEKKSISINQAVPIGLILNEIFSFLARYLAKFIKKLEVEVKLKKGSLYLVKVEIFSSSVALVRSIKNHQNGLQDQLVKELLKQLDAELKTTFGKKSSSISIEFNRVNEGGTFCSSFFKEQFASDARPNGGKQG